MSGPEEHHGGGAPPSSSPAPRLQGHPLLLAGTLLLVAGVNYGLHRARPRLAEASRLDEEAAALTAERDRLLADLTGTAADGIEAEVDALHREVAALDARLTAADRRFAAPSQAMELAVAVSALADAAQLRVEAEQAVDGPRAAPHPAGEQGSGDLLAALVRPPLERPLRSWTLRGDFRALWTFLDGLDDLPWRAVVVRLEVQRADVEGDLSIRMTVAL